jgi:hypothetical protein
LTCKELFLRPEFFALARARPRAHFQHQPATAAQQRAFCFGFVWQQLRGGSPLLPRSASNTWCFAVVTEKPASASPDSKRFFQLPFSPRFSAALFCLALAVLATVFLPPAWSKINS